jgi:putative DNA primase/helicase
MSESKFRCFMPFQMVAGEGLSILRTTITSTGRGKDKVAVESVEKIKICAPFEILAEVRDVGGGNWGKAIRWQDGDGITQTAIIRDQLSLAGNVLFSELTKMRLHPNIKMVDQFRQYMSGAKVSERIAITYNPGWHPWKGMNMFVTDKDGEHYAEDIIYAEGVRPVCSRKGSLTEWNRYIGDFAGQHQVLRLSIGVALSGPLLLIIKHSSYILNLFGGSSIGKTSAGIVGISSWGMGKKTSDNITTPLRSWNTTLTALETSLRDATDMVLLLDELSEAGANVVASAAYMVSGEEGRARGKSDGSQRKSASWRVPIISTGEITIEAKIRQAGEGRGSMNAGQSIRALDIPAVGAYGAFDDNCSTFGGAKEFSKYLRAKSQEYYGTLGPAFVAAILSHGFENTCGVVQEKMKAFIAQVKNGNWIPEVERAADTLALIAAALELAIDWKLLRWNPGDGFSAGAHFLKLWIGENKEVGEEGRNVPFTKRQLLEGLQKDIHTYGDSRYCPADKEDAKKVVEGGGATFMFNANERYGFKLRGGDYVIAPARFKYLCSQANITEELAIHYLKEKNWLIRGVNRGVVTDKPQTRIPSLGYSISWVRVSRIAFSEEEDDTPVQSADIFLEEDTDKVVK